MKHKKFFTIVAMSIFMIFSLLNMVKAYELKQYNIDSTEKILEKRVLNDKEMEIFTEKYGKYYKRHLLKEDNDWKTIENENIRLRRTGLKDNSINSTDINLGKKVEDKLKSSGIDINELPDRVDYSDSKYLPPVGDQGNEDSCVAWSTGYYLRTYQQARDIGWNVKNGDNMIPYHVFSTSFIYNQINGGRDDGANLDDAGELLKNVGAATLDVFPHVQGDYYTQPNQEQIKKAFPHRIKDWRILYTKYDSDDYILRKTKEYLNTQDFVVVGLTIGFKFQFPMIENDGTSIITTDESADKGHAVVVVGYDDNIETPEGKGAFKIINSWGKNWGDNGFSYITYKAFVSNLRVGFVFTDLINGPIVEDIKNINADIISPYKVKFTWDNQVNAGGYKIYDENKNIIANVYENSLIQELINPGRITRYIEAFNNNSSSIPLEVSADTSTIDKKEIPIEATDNVVFNINFSGKGIYDVEIYDEKNNLINSIKGLQSNGGNTAITWNGKTFNGNSALDGTYEIKIVTYKNEMKQQLYSYKFNKLSKIGDRSAKIYRYSNEIKSVQLDFLSNVNGSVSIVVKNNEESKEIGTRKLVNGEMFKFLIDKDLYDFNKVDLSKVSIELKVK